MKKGFSLFLLLVLAASLVLTACGSPPPPPAPTLAPIKKIGPLPSPQWNGDQHAYAVGQVIVKNPIPNMQVDTALVGQTLGTYGTPTTKIQIVVTFIPEKYIKALDEPGKWFEGVNEEGPNTYMGLTSVRQDESGQSFVIVLIAVGLAMERGNLEVGQSAECPSYKNRVFSADMLITSTIIHELGHAFLRANEVPKGSNEECEMFGFSDNVTDQLLSRSFIKFTK